MNQVSTLEQGLKLAEAALGIPLPPASFAENVVDFNKRVLKIDQRNVGHLSAVEEEISVKCLIEEITEFKEACEKGDIIGMVDAMVDLKYFATGVMYKLGLTAESIDAAELAVHNANMEKKLGINHHRGDGSAADAVKPEGWVAPEERIGKILDEQMASEV